MSTPNSTIINTLRILARDIESADGVPNAALHQAADRFVELVAERDEARERLNSMRDWLDKASAKIRQLGAENANLIAAANKQEHQND